MESGAGTAADWVVIETRQVRREARADLRLAEKLRGSMRCSRRRWRRAGQPGAGPGDRGVVGAAAVDRPSPPSRPSSDGGGDTPVSRPAEHDAKALRILGRRVLEGDRTHLAEEFEGRALEREEAEALRRTTLTMWEDDEGTCHGRFRYPRCTGRC